MNPSAFPAELQPEVEKKPPPSVLNIALDPTYAYRVPEKPEEVRVQGMLMLDTGTCIEIEARMSLYRFMQVQSLALLALSMLQMKPRADAPLERSACTWIVRGWEGPAARDGFRIVDVARILQLDFLAVEPTGLRLIESYPVSRVLPEVRAESDHNHRA
jgi:hypothetical protein